MKMWLSKSSSWIHCQYIPWKLEYYEKLGQRMIMKHAGCWTDSQLLFVHKVSRAATVSRALGRCTLLLHRWVLVYWVQVPGSDKLERPVLSWCYSSSAPYNTWRWSLIKTALLAFDHLTLSWPVPMQLFMMLLLVLMLKCHCLCSCFFLAQHWIRLRLFWFIKNCLWGKYTCLCTNISSNIMSGLREPPFIEQ